MHACVPSSGGRPEWFKSQCKTRLSYGRQKWGCQNMLVLLWAPAYLINPPFPLKSHPDLGLCKGNWQLEMLACFVLNKTAFFPSCFSVVATSGKRRWGGGTLFLISVLKKTKIWVNLRHLRSIYLSQCVVCFMCSLFTSWNIWICLTCQIRMAGSRGEGDYIQV